MLYHILRGAGARGRFLAPPRTSDGQTRQDKTTYYHLLDAQCPMLPSVLIPSFHLPSAICHLPTSHIWSSYAYAPPTSLLVPLLTSSGLTHPSDSSTFAHSPVRPFAPVPCTLCSPTPCSACTCLPRPIPVAWLLVPPSVYIFSPGRTHGMQCFEFVTRCLSYVRYIRAQRPPSPPTARATSGVRNRICMYNPMYTRAGCPKAICEVSSSRPGKTQRRAPCDIGSGPVRISGDVCSTVSSELSPVSTWMS